MADARAQYAIDIAAKLMGGDATIDQLDTLTASLMGGGKEADFFTEALASVDASMRAASAATATANSALASGVSHYEELEAAALQSAKAAERAALKNGGLIPPELFAEQEKAKSALDSHALALNGLESAAKLAKDEESRLSGVQRNLVKIQGHVAKSLAGTAEQSGKLKEAIGAVGGPLGGLAQKAFGPIDSFNKLSQTFGAARATSILLGLGIAAAVAAIVALSVAAAAGVVSLTSWGVSLSDTARSAALSDEAFQAAHPAMTGYAEAAERAASASGLAGDALRGLVTKLEAAKVSASDMPAALEAAAIAERALGNGGADKFIEGLKTGTKSVAALAAATKASLGGVVAKQLLSLDAQAARFKTNIGRTFGGLKIDPLLEGFQTLGKLFDADTASGSALKALFDGFVQPLIDGLTNAIPAIESFFLGLEIGFLRLAIFLKPATKALKEALGFDASSTESTLAAVATAGEYCAYAVGGLVAALTIIAAVVVPIVVVALGLLGAAITAAAAVVTGLFYLGYKIAEGLTEAFQSVAEQGTLLWDQIGAAFSKGLDGLLSFVGDALDAGKNIALGLAQGIADGATAIVTALTGAVSGAIDSAKKLLGIASPSKVFAEIGDNTIVGYSEGVDAAAPMARASVAEALEPPPARSLRSLDLSAPQSIQSDSGVSSSSSTDNSKAINLGSAVFNFYGVEGASDAEPRMREVLFQILSGELTQAGGAT